MRRSTYSAYGAVLTALFFAHVAFAQSQAPCQSETAKQFDFWLGTWRGTWTQDGVTKTALNVVNRSHDGCVVTEQFRAEQPRGLIGTSVSVWNPRTSQWQQTWVDNQGSYLAFTGGLDGTTMTLSREGKTREGKAIRQRMRFIDVTRDRFVWLWERQIDDEKTWSVQWRIEYARVEVATGDEPLAKFETLAGCWVSVRDKREYREHWMRPAGGMMVGMVRQIRDGKANSYEAMHIELDSDGMPVFVAQPKGQAETRFRLKEHTSEQIVFENPKHDFPQRIVYRPTNTTLDARIESEKEGKIRGIDFPLKRVSCSE
jgi:hypothetical protein